MRPNVDAGRHGAGRVAGRRDAATGPAPPLSNGHRGEQQPPAGEDVAERRVVGVAGDQHVRCLPVVPAAKGERVSLHGAIFSAMGAGSVVVAARARWAGHSISGTPTADG